MRVAIAIAVMALGGVAQPVSPQDAGIQRRVCAVEKPAQEAGNATLDTVAIGINAR